MKSISYIALAISLSSVSAYASLTQDEKAELEKLRSYTSVLLQDLKEYDAKTAQRTKEVKEEYALRRKLEIEKETILKDINIITPKLITDFKEAAVVQDDPNALLNAMKKLELSGMSEELQNRFEHAFKRYSKNSKEENFYNIENALYEQFDDPKTPRGHKIIDTMNLVVYEDALTNVARIAKTREKECEELTKENERFLSLLKKIKQADDLSIAVSEEQKYRISLLEKIIGIDKEQPVELSNIKKEDNN